MKALTVMISMLFMFEVSAHAATLKAKDGEVKFTAIGKPGFLKIRGESKGAQPEGSVQIAKDALTGEFSFDLQKLETGISLRDDHMKNKYLEVAKFPKAKLVLKPLSFTEADLAKDQKKDFTGTLTLHGETKDVTGKVEYTAASKKIAASFTILVSDFKIPIPEYLGVTVSEKVDVEVQSSLAQ